MKVTAIKTHKISIGENIISILDTYVPKITNGSVIAVSSKIVALCQKNVIKKKTGKGKIEYIPYEADYYLGDEYPMKYGQIISIKNNTLTASAGIDESNGNGYFILWPTNIQKITNEIWERIRKKNKIKNLGVIITDSRSVPLRWGVTGIALSWCGLKPIKSYVGKKDIFGYTLQSERTSIIDSLATAATLTMGEGNEQQPIAVIEDASFVSFQNRVPTKEEITNFRIDLNNDLFEPLLTSVIWEKGRK